MELSDDFPGLFELYKYNRCVTTNQNVAVSALFWGIMLGYDVINVWGLDNSNMYNLRVGLNSHIVIEEEQS